MSKEFDLKLKAAFPYLCKNMHGDSRVTCMAWGCDIGEGWQSIIWDLSTELAKVIPEDKKEDIYYDQIKQKMGGLRVYMSEEPSEVLACIKDAEKRADKTCEKCGDWGKRHGTGWLSVLCDECYGKK